MKKVAFIMVIIVLLSAAFTGCTAPVEEAPQETTVQEQAEKASETPAETPAEQPSNIVYEYEEIEIACTNDEKNIYGIAYVPINAGEKMPTIIFAHGYNGTHANNSLISQELAKKGIATYSFDFCGGSTRSASDGEMTEMSIFTEASDLNAVIDMVKKLDFVDVDNLFVFGESQGGIVSAITVNERSDEINGLMLLYPAFCIPDDAKELYASVDDIPETIKFMGGTIGRAYYENLLDYDVYSNIGNYINEVLIFHGDADTLVEISYSQKAIEVFSFATLEAFEGEKHGFTEDAQYKVAEMAYDFVCGYSH